MNNKKKPPARSLFYRNPDEKHFFYLAWKTKFNNYPSNAREVSWQSRNIVHAFQRKMFSDNCNLGTLHCFENLVSAFLWDDPDPIQDRSDYGASIKTTVEYTLGNIFHPKK